MESFEQRMDDLISVDYDLPFIPVGRALDLAREADAALAAKDAEIARLKAATCEKCQGKGWFADHSSGQYDHDGDGNCLGNCPVQVQCDCVAASMATIERMTALNTAKGDLINLFETHFDTLNLWHRYQDDFKAVRARIRSLENGR